MTILHPLPKKDYATKPIFAYNHATPFPNFETVSNQNNHLIDLIEVLRTTWSV